MAYGMSYDEYWHAEPGRTKAYREAYKIRVRQKEAELWRQGLYVLDALNVALHNNINLSGKTVTPAKYMEKPFEIIPLNKVEQKAEAEKARKEAVEGLQAWGKALRRKFNGNGDS